MPAKLAPLTIPVPESNDSIFANYLTRDQILKARGICARTWLRLEQTGDGPPRTVIGRDILYRRDSFMEWLRSREEHNGVRLSANGRPRRLRKKASSVSRNVRRARAA